MTSVGQWASVGMVMFFGLSRPETSTRGDTSTKLFVRSRFRN